MHSKREGGVKIEISQIPPQNFYIENYEFLKILLMFVYGKGACHFLECNMK